MDRRIVTLITASVLLAAIVVVVLVAGNGDDSDKNSGGEISKDLSTKPVIAASSDLPTSLETKDIVEGEGPAAKDGDTLTMQYVGVVTETGKEFDASWTSGQPFEFELGAGGVIKGWDEGIKGMKVGGRRELIIPPDLAYGAAGSPPDIPANATLTFVVDLTDIK
ncbi:MAG TPA: FKBP-type peptidyl-prolyl cis-trans isomerase [Solirubrobacterales bacterium]|nr:FKBP-type peptidyl-prolyl cis-trans isomerase [Solirubrobacterales bacterium]